MRVLMCFFGLLMFVFMFFSNFWRVAYRVVCLPYLVAFSNPSTSIIKKIAHESLLNIFTLLGTNIKCLLLLA